MGKIKIALLGKIPKGDDVRKEFVDWKEEYHTKISERIPQASFLNGDLITDDRGPELCVGHDLWILQHADVLIVDAQIKIGAGTAQEMIFAKLWKKPLVSVIPPQTHHRKKDLVVAGTLIEDWIHPFLLLASDHVADDIDSAVNWVERYAASSIKDPIKGIEVFDDAVEQFTQELPDFVEKYQQKGW